MKVVSVFAGVLVWLAMSPVAHGNTDAPVSESSFDPARGVLFAPERALQLLKQCSRTRFPAARETWQPNTSYSWHVQMWPRPITARELRALPQAFRDPDSWRRVPVVVCDGGPTYFGAIYDPEAGRVDEFSFNGV